MVKTQEIFKVLGDFNRWAIVHLLIKNQVMSVNDIVKQVNILQPTVSIHLKTLREHNIVKLSKRNVEDGRFRMYELVDTEATIQLLKTAEVFL